jgi:hypothetical protein
MGEGAAAIFPAPDLGLGSVIRDGGKQSAAAIAEPKEAVLHRRCGLDSLS